MAGLRKGGINSFTVQEAQNVALGQAGSMFNDGTAAMTPPTDHVFVAITFLTDVTFDDSVGLIAEDPKRYINTAATANPGGASGGLAVAAANAFPKGMTIYGRWTSINLDSTGTIIAYIGK